VLRIFARLASLPSVVMCDSVCGLLWFVVGANIWWSIKDKITQKDWDKQSGFYRDPHM
jgi:hypothetical protein